jgi:uncharacterized protein YeaO (DUF488 family)
MAKAAKGAARAGGGKPVPIALKRIYEPPAKDDGARILVDRLWPRGISSAKARLDLWLRDIAPSDELRHWFAHDPKRWPEFKRRYKAELKGRSDELRPIRDALAKGKATLLFAAHDEAHNNAVVVKELVERSARASAKRRAKGLDAGPRSAT